MSLPFALSISVLTFLLGVIWGGPFLELLKRLKLGKMIRAELGAHQKKMGTPTMGGIMIIVPVVVISLLLNVAQIIRTASITGASILLPLFVLISFGLLGAYDDIEGIRRSQGRPIGEGISARAKFAAQVVLATITALTISFFPPDGFQFANTITLPLIGVPIPLSPIFFVPICVFLIVGFSNASNLTDGMDGLAGIIMASAFAGYGVIAYLQGQTPLVQLSFTLVGACFAFLWFNAHPAKMFMGDCGSLALGATLATIAIMSGQWLLLPLIAIVPVAEVLSVVLQVAYFKRTRGQRLFRIAPLHHHFEEGGWSETQVVQRFWLVGLLAAMLGVALALL